MGPLVLIEMTDFLLPPSNVDFGQFAESEQSLTTWVIIRYGSDFPGGFKVIRHFHFYDEFQQAVADVCNGMSLEDMMSKTY